MSDEQIQDWADEGEAGYDLDELKRRGRGRPGRGAQPMQALRPGSVTAAETLAVRAITPELVRRWYARLEREHLTEHLHLIADLYDNADGRVPRSASTARLKWQPWCAACGGG